MSKPHNYHRFSGWRLVALLIVFALYAAWFIGPGYFGQLVRLEDYEFLQGRGFYRGWEAVAAVERLDAAGVRLKFLELGFDIIYMFLQAFVFEALIAFGLRHLGWMSTRWRWLLLLPMAYLFFDILEDGCLALLLTTHMEMIGSFAGVFTFLKMAFFLPCIPISLGFAVAGCVAWILRKGKVADSLN